MAKKWITNGIEVDLEQSNCLGDNGEPGDHNIALWTDGSYLWLETNGDPVLLDAAEIVRAVNNHERLVEALESARYCLEFHTINGIHQGTGRNILAELDSALAAARGRWGNE